MGASQNLELKKQDQKLEKAGDLNNNLGFDQANARRELQAKVQQVNGKLHSEIKKSINKNKSINEINKGINDELEVAIAKYKDVTTKAADAYAKYELEQLKFSALELKNNKR